MIEVVAVSIYAGSHKLEYHIDHELCVFTTTRDQIPVKVHFISIFNFTKYFPENIENTVEDDKERLSIWFEYKFCKNVYS